MPLGALISVTPGGSKQLNQASFLCYHPDPPQKRPRPEPLTTYHPQLERSQPEDFYQNRKASIDRAQRLMPPLDPQRPSAASPQGPESIALLDQERQNDPSEPESESKGPEGGSRGRSGSSEELDASRRPEEETVLAQSRLKSSRQPSLVVTPPARISLTPGGVQVISSPLYANTLVSPEDMATAVTLSHTDKGGDGGGSVKEPQAASDVRDTTECGVKAVGGEIEKEDIRQACIPGTTRVVAQQASNAEKEADPDAETEPSGGAKPEPHPSIEEDMVSSTTSPQNKEPTEANTITGTTDEINAKPTTDEINAKPTTDEINAKPTTDENKPMASPDEESFNDSADRLRTKLRTEEKAILDSILKKRERRRRSHMSFYDVEMMAFEAHCCLN